MQASCQMKRAKHQTQDGSLS